MPASITINQTTRPAGVAGTARNDLVVGQPVTCSNTTVETSYTWTLTDVPIRSALVRGTVGTGATFSFTPDVKGTYRVTLRVNNSSLASDNAVLFGAVLSTGSKTLGWRYFAAEEKREDNISRAGLGFPGNVNTRGWATDSDLQLEQIETSVWETLNAAITSPGLGADRLVRLDPATGLLDISIVPGAPPSGAAGGDLTGTYPNPTVAKLLGRTIDSTAPTTGDVLKWDGVKWAVVADDAFADGTAATPAMSFISEASTGIYKSAPGALSVSTLTVPRVTFAATNSTLATNWIPSADNTYDLGAPATRWANLYVANLVSSSISFPDGTAAAPSIAFSSDVGTNTGFYRPAENNIGVATNGADLARFTDAQVLIPQGTALVPGLGFMGEPTTGIYRVSAFTLGLAAGGILSTQAVPGGLRTVDGTAAAPSLSFINETTLGFYRDGAGVLGVATSGVERVRFTSPNSLLTSNWLPAADVTYNLGSAILRWNNLYADTITAGSITTTTPLDHGALGGLSDDDHTQYLLVDGTRSMSGTLKHVDGAVGGPAMTFASEPGLGWYRSAANTIALATAGVAYWNFQGSALRAGAAANSFSFTSLNATMDFVAVHTTSTTAPFTFSTSASWPYAASAGTQKLVRIAGTMNQSGTAGYSGLEMEITETATGSGTKRLVDAKVGGSTKFAVGNDGATLVGDGAVGAVGLGFVAESDTGLYRIGADTLGIAASGVEVVRLQAPAGANPQLLLPSGSATSPTLAFNAATGEGMYYVGGPSFTAGGAIRWRVSSNYIQAFTADSRITSVATNGALTIAGNVSNVAAAGVNITNSANFALNASTQQLLKIYGTAAQSGTAGYTALELDVTESSTGSGTKRLIDAKVGASTKFAVSNAGLTIVGDGGVSAAGLGFAAEPNTGLYRASAGTMGITLNGTLQWLCQGGILYAENATGGMRMDALNGILEMGGRVTTGTAAEALKFHNNASFSAAAGTQKLARFSGTMNQSATAGYTAVEIDITETATGSGTKRLIDTKVGGSTNFAVSNTGVVQIADGSVATPSLTFLNNPTTGISNGAALGPGVEGWLVSVAGSLVGGFLNEGTGGQLRMMAGTSAVPIIAVDQGDTGFYAPVGGKIAAVADGVEVFRWQAPGALAPQLLLTDGTNAAPSLAFQNGLDTGLRLYVEGDNDLALVAGGITVAYASGANGYFVPPSDDTIALGDAALRWNGVYTARVSFNTPSIPGSPVGSDVEVLLPSTAGRPELLAQVDGHFGARIIGSAFYDRQHAYILPSGVATPHTLGVDYGATGTITAPTLSSGTFRLASMRINLATSAVAGSSAAIYSKILHTWRGNAAGYGGFVFHSRFAPNTQLIANQRGFVGLTTSTGALLNVDPSTNTSIIGIGYDNADANLQIMHNDAAGAATKVDTGLSARNTTLVVDVWFIAPPNGGDIHWFVNRVDGTTGTASGTITTNLPATTQFLAMQAWVNNNATASSAVMEVMRLVIETPH